MRRFFVPGEVMQPDRFSLPKDVCEHLKVLRLRAGETIELLDGSGRRCSARIETIDREGVVVSVVARCCDVETAFPVHLLQSLPKGEKLELVLQKGVELGVSRFTPIVSARSVPRRGSSESREKRWRKVIQEAARQSRRPVLPSLDGSCTLEEGLGQVEAPLRLMLWEEGAVSLRAALPAELPSAAAVLVGPEGGFSSSEAELAMDAGFVPVLLGPRILRTETAGLAAVTLLQYLYGDLNHVSDEGDR